MNKQDIEHYWQEHFALCPPINYLLKVFYTNRWLLIHSLPDSKQYAETEAEWAILFETQNQILNDVFKESEELILFTGLFSHSKILFEDEGLIDNEALKSFVFEPLQKIDLYAMSKEYCEANTFYTPHFVTVFYKANGYIHILKSIANDKVRAFFLSPTTNSIVAPYDGGVDIFYADTTTRDFYKIKYSNFTQQEFFR
jgi:hypothetical protein